MEQARLNELERGLKENADKVRALILSSKVIDTMPAFNSLRRHAEQGLMAMNLLGALWAETKHMVPVELNVADAITELIEWYES